ncbi:MAG: acetate kinase [Erysipelotrichaceae bacterium]|nr:acetate kinase [Erysipelotrichaceae bacterium]
MSKVMSVNAGSSSLKFQLFLMPEEEVLTSGVVERIGMEEGIFTIKVNGEKRVTKKKIENHGVAVAMLLDALVSNGIVKELNEIEAVGHRVLHGGEIYGDSAVFDEKVEQDIIDLTELGPLHMPANLLGYRAFRDALPGVKHVAVYDTAFHQTMPKDIFLYPLPYEYYENFKVRKYGFHGTSHKYVSERCAELMGKDPKDVNIITCHLGNGASLCAVQGGKSVNTSMGFTPLAGIMMGTRSGDIDPAVISFLMNKTGMTAEETINVLNKKSGFLGVSCVSSDARDIEAAVQEGNEKAILSRKMYCDRLSQTIGSYFVQLGHVDAIVFTAGLGENDVKVRAEALDAISEALQITYNKELNSTTRGKEVKISNEDSKIQVWVIPTNEELVIARDVVRLTGIK